MTPEPGRWCAELAADLEAASDHTARLAVRIAEDWLDDRGREWSERATLLRHELDRVAQDAARLGARLADQDAVAGPPIVPVAARRRGPRLGGTGGAHVDGGYGMRLAELPPT